MEIVQFILAQCLLAIVLVLRDYPIPKYTYVFGDIVICLDNAPIRVVCVQLIMRHSVEIPHILQPQNRMNIFMAFLTCAPSTPLSCAAKRRARLYSLFKLRL